MEHSFSINNRSSKQAVSIPLYGQLDQPIHLEGYWSLPMTLTRKDIMVHITWSVHTVCKILHATVGGACFKPYKLFVSLQTTRPEPDWIAVLRSFTST